MICSTIFNLLLSQVYTQKLCKISMYGTSQKCFTLKCINLIFDKKYLFLQLGRIFAIIKMTQKMASAELYSPIWKVKSSWSTSSEPSSCRTRGIFPCWSAWRARALIVFLSAWVPAKPHTCMVPWRERHPHTSKLCEKPRVFNTLVTAILPKIKLQWFP